MAGRFTLIEAELRQQPLRTAWATREGLRKLLFSLVPLAAAVGAATYLYYSREQPDWVDSCFFIFGVAGGVALLRLTFVWLNRIALVEAGVPVSAVVVWKEPVDDGQARFYAWYSHGRRQWGIGWKSDESDAEIGDAVTVLCRSHRPADAVVYRWAGYSARKPSI